jgi:hypothetical protein
MKFIHIGCWNYKSDKNTNNKEESNVLIVLKSLNNYVKNNFTGDDFIVIAGDNYYPNIEKYNTDTIKWIDIDEMLSNFSILPKDTKKYLLFGNNDINDKTIIDPENKEKIVKIFKDQKGFNSYKNITEDTEEMKTCRLVDIEMLYTKDKNYKVFNGVMHEFYKKNLVIMIDTSIYDNEIYDESVQCYKRILNTDYDKDLTLEELIKGQNKVISELIINNIDKCKNIVIIGHHPICGMTSVNKSTDCYFNNKLADVFRNISKIIKLNKVSINVTYLCSHIHLYEYTEINIDDILIKQYICGCGGAYSDELTQELTNKPGSNYEVIIRHDDIYLKIKSVINNTFGYLNITLSEDDGDVNVEFIKVITKEKPDFEKKYIKYKNKYLLQKN